VFSKNVQNSFHSISTVAHRVLGKTKVHVHKYICIPIHLNKTCLSFQRIKERVDLDKSNIQKYFKRKFYEVGLLQTTHSTPFL